VEESINETTKISRNLQECYSSPSHLYAYSPLNLTTPVWGVGLNAAAKWSIPVIVDGRIFVSYSHAGVAEYGFNATYYNYPKTTNTAPTTSVPNVTEIAVLTVSVLPSGLGVGVVVFLFVTLLVAFLYFAKNIF